MGKHNVYPFFCFFDTLLNKKDPSARRIFFIGGNWSVLRRLVWNMYICISCVLKGGDKLPKFLCLYMLKLYQIESLATTEFYFLTQW